MFYTSLYTKCCCCCCCCCCCYSEHVINLWYSDTVQGYNAIRSLHCWSESTRPPKIPPRPRQAQPSSIDQDSQDDLFPTCRIYTQRTHTTQRATFATRYVSLKYARTRIAAHKIHNHARWRIEREYCTPNATHLPLRRSQFCRSVSSHFTAECLPTSLS